MSGDFQLLGYSGSELRISWNNLKTTDKSISDYLPNGYRKIDLEAVKWLKKLSHETLPGGRSLHDCLEFESSSLWWFFESSIYREIFKEISRSIAILDSICAIENPLSLSIINDGSVLYKTVKKFCEHKDLKFESAEPSYNEKSNSRKNFWKPTALTIRNLLRNTLAPNFKYSDPTTPRVLITSMAREQFSINKKTKKQEPDDLILATVINQLISEECSVVQLYKYPYGNRVKVPGNISRHRQVVTWDSFNGRRIKPSYKKQKNTIHKEWLRLSGNNEFRSLWDYQGISLWEIISDVLRDLWFRNGNAAAEYLLLSKVMLEETKPDIVVMASDTSLDNKAVLVQSNNLNIPVISIQHGTILAEDDYLCDYSHIKEDFDGITSKSSLYPLITCLFGPESHEVMANQIGYVYSERLQNIGQPRFDQLIDDYSIDDRALFLEAFSLDPAKKTALIASQTFKIAGNKHDFFEVILSTLKSIQGLQIIIKPHPVEPESYIKKLAQRLGAKVTVLPSNFDISQAIKSCDFLVTSYSTVAIEAMVANKPVITINLTGMPDVVPYANEGAALGVVNAEELLDVVTKITDDPAFVHQQTSSAKQYIDRELTFCDGKVTERFVKLIFEHVKPRL